MDSFKINVDKNYENLRLDKFISEIKSNLSRNQIQKMIDNGQIKVNNKKEKKSYKVSYKDQIVIYRKEDRLLDLAKKEMDLDIIFEDEEVIVINKPAGLIVHPVKGNKKDTLVNALLAHSEKLGSINGTIRPGIVHRLDKNTSGTIVVAKSQKSLNNLIKQFKKRQVKKVYRTILKGTLPYNSGTIDAPIGRDPKNRTRMAVVKKNSKKAITEFKVIKRFSNYSYLKVVLKTGRTHQIRVHFAYIGFPILGDNKYGGQAEILNLDHLLLHAYQLGFYHPLKDNWVEFEAELPEEFKKTLAKIRNKK